MEQSNQPQVQQPLPNATMILVLGILSIVVCFITGIIALVMAKKETELYNNNPGLYSESSFSSVKAGRICSIIGLVLWGIGILVYIAMIAFFVSAVGASGGFDN
ncbi:MAG TPA: CCC motif membrane protein [Lacibacter sp.]|jgi:hypothetical protein|nr:CCC motif membrane protein [Lacibacter sp.]